MRSASALAFDGSSMDEEATLQWRIYARWLAIGLVLLAIPFPYYWWSLQSGALLPEAEWYAGGRNPGPWRWKFPGMYVVLFPLYSLFFGAPLVILLSVRRAWIASRPRLILGGVAVAICYFALFYLQASTLFWTID